MNLEMPCVSKSIQKSKCYRLLVKLLRMIIPRRTRVEVRGGEYEDYSVLVFDVTWYGIVSDTV